MSQLVDEESLRDVIGYLRVQQNPGLYIEILRQSPHVKKQPPKDEETKTDGET